MTTADECRYLAAWAERYGARLQTKGECGFGRECVGVVHGTTYPYYRAYGAWDGEDVPLVHECVEAEPPREVTDAYHKSDCLAVLGSGPEAIHQLWLWVQHLERQGIGIVVRPRVVTDMIDLMIHGHEHPLLMALSEGPLMEAGRQA